MNRLLGKLSLHQRMLLVLLIPLAGLVAFATLWASERRSTARAESLTQQNIEMATETSQMLAGVSILAASADLAMRSGGPSKLGSLASFALATMEGTHQDVLRRRSRMQALASGTDPETRRLVEVTVDHLDQLLPMLTRDGTISSPLGANQVFSDATVRQFTTTEPMLAADLDRLRDHWSNSPWMGEGAALMGLTALRQVMLDEGSLAIARWYRPNLVSAQQVDDAVVRTWAAEMGIAAVLRSEDRARLTRWPERDRWAAVRAKLVRRDQDVNVVEAIRLVQGRTAEMDVLQTSIGRRMRDAASERASRARFSFVVAVIVAVSLAWGSLLLAMLVLRDSSAILRRLARHAERIGSGDLTVEATLTAGRGDTAVLARAFNEMTATLTALQSRVDALADGDGMPDEEPTALPGAIGASLARSVARLSEMTGRLRTSEQVARLTVNTAVEAIWMLDDTGRVMSANPAASRLSGHQEEHATGHRITEGLRWSGVAIPDSGMPAEVTEREASIRSSEGTTVDALVTIRHVTGPDGSRRAMVFVRDITDRKRLEQQLEWDALHDPLTRLPNRSGLRRTLEAMLLDDGDRVAVMFIDLDRFKQVNDALGHHPGDELLRQVAIRLRHRLRESDVLARLGGDEFVVVHRNPGADEELDEIAARLIEAVEEPFALAGSVAHVSASVGIAVAPGGTEPSEIIRRADLAMYHAKQAGRARSVRYDDSMQDEVRTRVALEERLRAALVEGQLEAWYQPIVSLDGERLEQVELLARWHPPDQEPVPPEEFIGVAEESGLITGIGRWALAEAARQAVALRAAIPGFDAAVAVNISGMHLVHGDVPADLRAALAETGARPEWLRLEITESYLIEESVRHVDRMLTELREIGVRMSVDDFGTGHSSLTYLRRIPADVVKIDRSYVTALTRNPGEVEVIRLVVSLAHGLGMRVVAEGIEHEGQRALLEGVSVDMAQGFMFARPMTADALGDWIRDHAASEGTADPGMSVAVGASVSPLEQGTAG